MDLGLLPVCRGAGILIFARQRLLDGAAGRLDLAARLRRGPLHPHAQALGDLPIAQQLDGLLLPLFDQAGRPQRLQGDRGPVLEALVERADLDQHKLHPEGVAEALLVGHRACEGERAADEGGRLATAGACELPLGAPAGRLAAAGAHATAKTAPPRARLLIRPQFVQFHVSSPAAATPDASGISSTLTRCATRWIIPRTDGVSSCSSVLYSLWKPRERIVSFCRWG